MRIFIFIANNLITEEEIYQEIDLKEDMQTTEEIKIDNPEINQEPTIIQHKKGVIIEELNPPAEEEKGRPPFYHSKYCSV